ncbi:MurR/RpiR family transcriptional regulator [Schnuerera sp. xch1]|uniref:MurR/RpiR family transcriptional regulator n=1 Tax=Schnuerera sp. xch1 TaxID=2874283 RepID=UPI001CBE7174|nr:MurR/RpiR family transcriptional regulator [Schnuerera sp. xch1]MBZ2175992.1 MurR/RpiR family transcriptional regulator [Schnuerera sp. xch1]
MNNSQDIFGLTSRINSMLSQFTKTDWKIVQFMKNNTEKFINNSTQQLASEIGISDASIIRFAQKIGYSGLSELKYTLQRELNYTTEKKEKKGYSLLCNEYKLLTDSLFSLFNPNEIDLLCEKITKSSRIFIVGVDTNTYISGLLTHKFMNLGLNFQSITTYDALKIYSQTSTSSDLIIVISLSGNRIKLSKLMECFHKNKSYIALISNYEKSLCSRYSDLVFLIPKTNLLENSNSISREILILQLFDIFFYNIISKNTSVYEKFLAISSFANENDDDRNPLSKLKDLL